MAPGLMPWGMETDKQATGSDSERGISQTIKSFIPSFLLVLIGIGTLAMRANGIISDTTSSIVFAVLIAAGLVIYVLLNHVHGRE